MPNNDFISNILEIKDLIITNVESTSEEIHIYFKMERRDHVCPCCGAVTNKVHDYRPSIIKDAPIMGKTHIFITQKEDITVIVVANISTRTSLYFLSIAELQTD